MSVLQAFLTDGNEFAFIAGGTAAFGKPEDRSIPQHILFALHDALDIGLDVVVFMNGNRFFESFYIKKPVEIIFPAKLGVLGRGHQVLQYFPLGIERILLPGINTPETHTGKR